MVATIRRKRVPTSASVAQQADVTDDPKKKQHEYFQKYYKDKKDDIAANRKKRYRTDPAYRRQVIETNSSSYAKRKARKKAEAVSELSTGKHYDDLGNQLFTISEVAVVTGKAIFTIRKYHDQGVLPEPTNTSARGWRLYTQDQLLWLKRLVRECTDIERNYTDLNCLQTRISRVWDKPFSSTK